ncbi:JAB1/Mov34/MPN/PAD-1 ubiquitin protease-domain-containing protein [Obelidium mucronatum]|nr:JAB1/Mov34/MPN/PAD-1 ubiquitin protease-domain-containing protein [Obelidium mucronatum]
MSQVVVAADVYLALSTYALATEKEETLAMLMGTTSGDGQVVTVTHCLFCQRKDKRKDRVEISSEQLSEAISYAEATETAVIGWAHSHPHITVLPSHVDLRCQRDQQMLSESFIGLILSVFNDFNGVQKCQLIAFRSVADGGDLVRQEVPVFIGRSDKGITPESLQQLYRIPAIFLQEENEFFNKAISGGSSNSSKKEEQDKLKGMQSLETSHYSGVYLRNMTSVLDKLCVPLVEAVEARHARNLAEIVLLKETLRS